MDLTGRVRQLGCGVEARGSHQKGGRRVQCSGGRSGDRGGDHADSGAYRDDCRGSDCSMTGCGTSAGLLVGSAANLEHPPLGGSGWDGTETDLKEHVLELEADDLDEKIINDGVKVKRFTVRAWGGVHMSQSGQENPGAECGDKDSDIGRIDDEECAVKDRRHTQRSNVKQRGETGVDAIRRENEAVGCSMR